MAAPTIGDLTTMTSQFYDVQVISANGAAPGSNVTPTNATQKYWRAIAVTVGGTLIVDTLGVGAANPQTSVTISVPAGILQLACTQVHTGGTATGITGLY